MIKRHSAQEVHDGQVDTVLIEPVGQLHSIGTVWYSDLCHMEEHLVVDPTANTCTIVT